MARLLDQSNTFDRHPRGLINAMIVACVGTLAACSTPPPPPLSTQHLSPGPQVAGRAPDFAVAPPLPKPPRPSVRQELYSVVMSNVNVQDLLFALARDAKLNIDIHPRIAGTVTMNVRDQTMTEILDRVARQVDLRYEIEGKNLSIQPDSPYLRHYRVDYPNIQRDTKTAISTSTNVASTGGSGGSSGGSSGGFQTGGVVSSIASFGFKQFRLGNGDTDLSAMLSLLESFGTLRVLSSPKISVLNNQASVLKVVDNKVYFSITVTPGTAATANVPGTAATYSTNINTVPIGFLMNVVPQISESSEVTLNLRPTISRITGYATDPNPVLAQNNLVNRIPEVQTREMESVLRVQSGDIAILGGLMQDSRNNNSDEVPGLNRLPGLSDLFKYRNDNSSKSELVIFLRPTVLVDPSLETDLKEFRSNLPTTIDVMRANPGPNRDLLPTFRN